MGTAINPTTIFRALRSALHWAMALPGRFRRLLSSLLPSRLPLKR